MHKALPRLDWRHQLGIRSSMFGCGQYCFEYGHPGNVGLPSSSIYVDVDRPCTDRNEFNERIGLLSPTQVLIGGGEQTSSGLPF